MGSGKTEAALWLAYRLMATGQARGLYFGLPTRVTSDRIHRRVKEFLTSVHPSGIEPPLVHGQSWLRDMPKVTAGWRGGGEAPDEERPADQTLAVQRWFASSRCGLLAPFAVGTVDQALLGVIAAKWFFVRQFALAGKVVVLDEVHSYDLYTGTLIARLVQRLRELKATPVILSATLTAAQRAKLLGENPPKRRAKAAYPLLTVKTGSSAAKHLPIEGAVKPKTVQIQTLPVSDFDSIQCVAAKAVELASQGRCVLWIRNTVRQAQETCRMLNGEKCSGSFEVGLLHSRFPAFQRGSYLKLSLEELIRRNLHEERWLWMLGKPEPPRTKARPKGCILVSTQVVEQSVDIDADVLITDLAPTDMLLQRLGRLHRHEENAGRGQPTCWLVVPQNLAEGAKTMTAADIKAALGSVGHVYAPYVLLRTLEQWATVKEVTLPGGIRDLLEATYDERASKLRTEPKGWRELRAELDNERSKLEALALNVTNVRKPLKEDEEGLGTRYSTQRQIRLLMVRWLSKEVDRAGNPADLHLLNGSKLPRQDYLEFKLQAAKVLHLNVATIPAWWLPKALRAPLPSGLAQYFPDGAAMALYDGEHSQLGLAGNNDSQAPVICYHPGEGLWLEKQPVREVINLDDDGEDDDGMF
jgi:CRISPR-associated endonuclease/helicase Cas3